MTYDVAHIREQGQDVILVVVARRPSEAEYARLQVCATEAGLAGAVAAVWNAGGRPEFLGPRQWHSYLSSLSWAYIAANANRKLTCP